jgi:Gas vesicle synthesis protein GvpO
VAERRPVRSRPRPDRDDDEYRRYDDERDEQGNGADSSERRLPRHVRAGDHRRRPEPVPPPRRDASVPAAEAARLGLRQIAELTGKPTEGVAWVQPSHEHGWAVGVEIVEDRRIPSAADILAIYETELDQGGEVLSYRRVRRYSRGRGDEGDGGS